jgi:uncharacterized protein YukE
MADIWGAVVGPAIGVVGALSGVLLGRRSVRDQAQVEHEQWLRGQRQEAYVALFDAWDKAMVELQQLIDESEERIHYNDRSAAYPEDIHDGLVRAVDRAAVPVRRPLERVQLLGPDAVDVPCAEMGEALRHLEASLMSHAATPQWPNHRLYQEACRLAAQARRAFLEASREAMRTPPRPGRRRRLSWRRRG